jgi:hypothetical protein
MGEIPNSCKCLWIQAGRELAAVQLLFLGLKSFAPHRRWLVIQRAILASIPVGRRGQLQCAEAGSATK